LGSLARESQPELEGKEPAPEVQVTDRETEAVGPVLARAFCQELNVLGVLSLLGVKDIGERAKVKTCGGRLTALHNLATRFWVPALQQAPRGLPPGAETRRCEWIPRGGLGKPRSGILPPLSFFLLLRPGPAPGSISPARAAKVPLLVHARAQGWRRASCRLRGAAHTAREGVPSSGAREGQCPPLLFFFFLTGSIKDHNPHHSVQIP
jgi:hypothetical protein